MINWFEQFVKTCIPVHQERYVGSLQNKVCMPFHRENCIGESSKQDYIFVFAFAREAKLCNPWKEIDVFGHLDFDKIWVCNAYVDIRIIFEFLWCREGSQIVSIIYFFYYLILCKRWLHLKTQVSTRFEKAMRMSIAVIFWNNLWKSGQKLHFYFIEVKVTNKIWNKHYFSMHM